MYQSHMQQEHPDSRPPKRVTRETIAAMRSKEARRRKNDSIALRAFAVAVVTGLQLLLAQGTAWGLALFHVSSGIGGPFILIVVATAVIGLGVLLGRLG